MKAMKNATPIIIVLLALVIGLCAPSMSPSWMQDRSPAIVVVDHLSASRTSDGTLMVYCMLQNVDTIPATNFNVRITAMDSNNVVVRSRELIMLRSDTLRPGQKALFTESFDECWECHGIRVVVF